MADTVEQNTSEESRKGNSKILPILGVCIVVLLIVFFIGRNIKSTQKQSEQPTVTPVPQMKTYKDSSNYFSITAPDNWTSTKRVATSTTGLKTTHPVTTQIEITQIYVPADMGVTVQVYKTPPTCPLVQKPTTTLAGLPASYNDAIHTWTIPTTTALVSVSIAYPGSGGFHGPARQVQPTAVPQSVVDADKKLLEQILTTLKLNNLQPFSC